MLNYQFSMVHGGSETPSTSYESWFLVVQALSHESLNPWVVVNDALSLASPSWEVLVLRLLSEDLALKDLPQLYRAADAFVLPSRGGRRGAVLGPRGPAMSVVATTTTQQPTKPQPIMVKLVNVYITQTVISVFLSEDDHRWFDHV